jgi:hypothetical protein
VHGKLRFGKPRLHEMIIFHRVSAVTHKSLLLEEIPFSKVIYLYEICYMIKSCKDTTLVYTLFLYWKWSAVKSTVYVFHYPSKGATIGRCALPPRRIRTV